METLTIVLAVATIILIIYSLIILTVVLKLVLGIRRLQRNVDTLVSQSKDIASEIRTQVMNQATPWSLLPFALKKIRNRGV